MGATAFGLFAFAAFVPVRHRGVLDSEPPALSLRSHTAGKSNFKAVELVPFSDKFLPLRALKS